MTGSHLVLISIGPVQDFIASARKLRDLWFGSFFLSELSKSIARSLVEQGADLIFPCTTPSGSSEPCDNTILQQQVPAELEPESSLIVANKIMAELPMGCDPSRAIIESKRAWEKRRSEFAQAARKKIDEIKTIHINSIVFEQQITDPGEFHGAWIKMEKPSDYMSAKQRLETLLAGRKKLRNFNKPAWEGKGIIKNSLDGVREAVMTTDQEEIIGLLKKNEKLDTLGCIKRFAPLTMKSPANQRKHFEDLSQVALIPYLEGCIARDRKTEATEGFTGLLTDFYSRISGKSLSIDRDDPDNMKRFKQLNAEYFFMEESQIKEKKAWGAYRKMIQKCGRPPTYACILLGDGDNMGQLINAIRDIQGHRIITRYLSRFAKEVETCIADDHGGCLIYAGGDDVMAYAPLNRLLACADAIQQLFKTIMKQALVELRSEIPPPTFSIGAAIVHHAAPLDKALELARKAEQSAKMSPDKNSFSIIRSKRSGSDLIISDSWESDTKEGPGFTARLQTMCDLFNDNILPGTLGFQLRQVSKETGESKNDKGLLQFSMSDGRMIPHNAATALALSVLKQKEHKDKLNPLLHNQKPIQKLADELVVTQQIARAEKMSQGDHT
jgi:CRISPR-associated protein Cmr2